MITLLSADYDENKEKPNYRGVVVKNDDLKINHRFFTGDPVDDMRKALGMVKELEEEQGAMTMCSSSIHWMPEYLPVQFKYDPLRLKYE